MLSRATAGTVGRKAIFALPGSRGGPAGDEKLIVPELGHVIQQISGNDSRTCPNPNKPTTPNAPTSKIGTPRPCGTWELREWLGLGVGNRELSECPSKMRPFGKTIALDEARAIIERAVRTDRPHRSAFHSSRPTDACSHRTSSRPPTCRRSRERRWTATPSGPKTRPARAARRHARCAASRRSSPDRLRSSEWAPGECAEIATGAPMPDGADAVVMVEETDIDERGTVSDLRSGSRRVRTSAARARTSRRASTSCSRAHVLNASRLGAIAALGLTDVEVYAKPRVAILSTGNEIVDPGQPLAPGQIYDINRVTVSAVVAEQRRHRRSRIAPRPTRSRICRARWTSVSSRTSWSSQAVAPSASVTSSWTSSRPRARCCFTASRSSRASRRPSAASTASSSSACRATPPPVCRTPTSCSHPRFAAWHACHQQIVRSLTPPARRARRVGAGPAPVLLGACRERHCRARLQGLRRHHQHVAGRRVHRDSLLTSRSWTPGTLVEVKLFCRMMYTSWIAGSRYFTRSQQVIYFRSTRNIHKGLSLLAMGVREI